MVCVLQVQQDEQLDVGSLAAPRLARAPSQVPERPGSGSVGPIAPDAGVRPPAGTLPGGMFRITSSCQADLAPWAVGCATFEGCPPEGNAELANLAAFKPCQCCQESI